MVVLVDSMSWRKLCCILWLLRGLKGDGDCVSYSLWREFEDGKGYENERE